ncbi:MAG: branched-chain amino acid ABC transporter permease [Chloroflexota bacterium]
METLLIQLLNGLVFSMLLFILATGLSLIFGQMHVINLAHGSFYLLGGYLGLSFVRRFESFWLALLLAPLLVAGLGLVIEYFLLRRLYGSHRRLDQVLFTFGLALVAADLMRWKWGAYVETISPPALLAGQIPIFTIQIPVYRLSLIGFGLGLAVLLWLLLEQTRLGALIRAGVANAQMVSGLGIDIHLVFAGVFAFGTALAALAGVVGAPVLNLYPGLDFEILILTLVVVVVGGLGTFKGAFFGSLLIGLANTFGKAVWPELSLLLIFAVMAMVLFIRPAGLFGQKGS